MDYFNTPYRQLIVKLNKICRSDDFLRRFLYEFHFAPAGMTIHPKPIDGTEFFEPILVCKKYGYESSSTGLDIYDDLDDYEVGEADFTDEQIKFVLDYFKLYYPEIYSQFKINKEIA